MPATKEELPSPLRPCPSWLSELVKAIEESLASVPRPPSPSCCGPGTDAQRPLKRRPSST